jgi:hypothetical protein
MSWGTCYSGSNNIHFGFPPLMTDGRNYASWQPEAVVNKTLQENSGMKTNWDYRKYLVDNADSIMKYNQLESCDQCCACPAQYGDNQPPTGTPFLFKSCTDSTQPYGYENSNLKKEYLTREQLQSRMTAPRLSQYQYLEQHLKNSN